MKANPRLQVVFLILAVLALVACGNAESLVEKGGEQAQAGELAEALESFDSALEKDPDYAPAYYGRAEVYLQQGEYDLVAADLTKVMDLDPGYEIATEFAEVFDQLGQNLHEAGEVEQAIAAFERCLAIDGDYSDAYYHRAAAYLDGGQPDLAAADLDQMQGLAPAKSIDKSFAVAYCERADKHMADGKLEAALDDFDKALSVDPGLIDGLLGRAAVLLQQDQFERAAADLDQALKVDAGLELDPQFAQAYFGRAKDHQSQGELEAAASDLNHVLTLDPDFELGSASAEVFFQCGQEHFSKGDGAKAQVDLEQALAIDPAHAEATVFVGLVMFDEGDLEGSISQLERAMQLDAELVLPSAAAAPYFERATVAFEEGDYEAALGDAESALAIDAAHPETLALRGSIYLKTGDTDRAVLDLLAARDQGAESASLYLNLGTAQLQRDNNDLALEALDEALALDDTLVDAYFLRAQAQEAAGELDLALADLDSVIELDPTFVEAYMARGRIYAAQASSLEDPEEITALIVQETAEYSAVLELEPENQEALFNRGLAYSSTSDWEAAQADFLALLALDEDNAEAHYRLGIAFSNLDEKDEAIASIEKALELGLPEDLTSEAETLLADLKKPPPLPWEVWRNIPVIPGDNRADRVYFSSGPFSVMVYSVEKSVDEALAFYRSNMSRMGWVADGEEFSDGAHHLYFTRGNQAALVIIEGGANGTVVGLTVGPL